MGKRRLKYDPLRDYLRIQKEAELNLTFSEIERIINASLPKSAKRPQWWANERRQGNHSQREAWRAARYDAFLLSASKVRFVKKG